MQKPAKKRIGFLMQALAPSATPLTQTDCRHPFVMRFFFATCQASEGADYIYIVDELPNPVSNFTCMLNF